MKGYEINYVSFNDDQLTFLLARTLRHRQRFLTSNLCSEKCFQRNSSARLLFSLNAFLKGHGGTETDGGKRAREEESIFERALWASLRCDVSIKVRLDSSSAFVVREI